MSSDVGLDRVGDFQWSEVGALDVLHELKLVDEIRVEIVRHLEARHGGQSRKLGGAIASLAGVPFTAGFLGKFFVFGSAIKIGVLGHPELIVLAGLGVVNSVISVYYYFNVVGLMFFTPGESKPAIQGTVAVNTAVVVTLVLTLALLVFAKPVSEIASSAVYTVQPIMTGSGR